MFGRLKQWLKRLVKPRVQERQCQRCNRRQTFHITDVSRTGVISELHLCEACAKSVLTKAYQPLATSAANDRADEVPIEVERVVITETHDQQLVVFREIGGARRCQCLIGIFEATAIDRRLKGLSAPRPLTHDAWIATIQALGAQVKTACINGLSSSMEKTFLAELRLAIDGSEVPVDVRPSDAVAIAIISASPLVMSSNLLTNADKAIEWGV